MFVNVIGEKKCRSFCHAANSWLRNFLAVPSGPLGLERFMYPCERWFFLRVLYLLTYLTFLLTPWCRVLLEKLTVLQLVKKSPAFHGTRRFITALTSVRQLSLSWASPIQSIYPHPTSRRSILILSTHLRLGLPSGLLPSGFPAKTLYTLLSSPIRATFPAHLILLHFITHTILGEEYKSFSSLLCNLLHSPVTSSLLGPNILLNTMFCSQTPSVSFPPAVSTTKFHTHTKQQAKLLYLRKGTIGNKTFSSKDMMTDDWWTEKCTGNEDVVA